MLWRSWGDGGDPVVLFHGGSGSWNHWVRNIVPLLEAGRQVWVPDLPGFGDSASPPSGGDADALPAPMEAALRTLLGDTAVDLVGFSFGTMVATFIA
ncbi:MAG: alpha/beta fold hydrolase, partial [Burkholderiaceae bacterium]